MPTDRVFLTGGSGFLGGHVLRRLLAAGYEVRALARDAASTQRIAEIARNGTAGVVSGDLRRPGEFARALDGCRYVVHCAAEYSLGPAQRESMHAVNVKGTAGLLEAARIAGVERAIVTSSSAALGPSHDGSARTESDWEDRARGGGYHASKVLQERAAFASRVPIVSLLPTAPIGPGDWKPTPTGQMIVDFARGKMFARPPRGGINVVPVEDVAGAHVAALQLGRSGERYVLGGENLTLDALWELLGAATGVRVPRRRIPGALVVAIAHADELRSRVTSAKPRIPVEGARMAREMMFARSDKAARELGFVPGSVRDALERAVAWYREKGYCP